jgi:hypothetical protein
MGRDQSRLMRSVVLATALLAVLMSPADAGCGFLGLFRCRAHYRHYHYHHHHHHHHRHHRTRVIIKHVTVVRHVTVKKAAPPVVDLPTLAMAQTPNVDPSLKRIHTQTIGINTTTGAVDPRFPTYFLVGPSINTSSFGALAEQFVSQTSAVSGTFKNLYIAIPTAAGPGSLGTTSTYTWRVNGISTGITCTIIAPALTCSDLTHTAPIVAGQSYDLQTVGVGSTFSAVFGGIELDTP